VDNIYPRTISPWTISSKQPTSQLRFQLRTHYFHQLNVCLTRIPCINPASSSVRESMFSSTFNKQKFFVCFAALRSEVETSRYRQSTASDLVNIQCFAHRCLNNSFRVQISEEDIVTEHYLFTSVFYFTKIGSINQTNNKTQQNRTERKIKQKKLE